MKVKYLVLTVLAVTFTAGCIHSPGGIAPSTTPLTGQEYRILGDVTGTDTHFALFGFIPLTGSNTTQEAIDDALSSRGGDAMIDITVESYWQYWILFSRSVTAVYGKAIRINTPSHYGPSPYRPQK